MPAAGDVATSRPTRLGRYELITRIGQGGMAEVQLALQRGPAGFEKLVVVKLVHNSLATQKAFVDMLLDEARVAALVKHPNVVDIYDLGQADGRYFIAMEYLEGEPLLAVLRAGREGKRLDTLSTGRLIADTAEGLDAAHELRSMSGDRLELVHHDISLGNIVVLYNGQVKLVDFGVAKATQSAGSKSKVQGKFSYMAPEKLKGAAGDRRSDIFSLGCVMWEALTLKRLFRGGNDAETMKQVLEMAIQPPSKINGDVPPEYDPIVMRALERDPDRRHGTAKEMAVEIEELLRKRGYGAKNDKIARYMQDTFRSHIDARKKLVQEVVNKGSASAEVLDAAFSDPVLASGSPVTPAGAGNDFSVKYRRVTPASGVPVPTAAWADASAPTTISPPPVHPMFGADGTATEIAPLLDEDKLDATDVAESELTPGVPIGERMRALATKARALAKRGTDAASALLADKRKRLYVMLGAAAALLLIVIIAIATGSGDDTKQVAAGKAGTASHVSGNAQQPDEHGSGERAGAASIDNPDEIEIDPGSDSSAGTTGNQPDKPDSKRDKPDSKRDKPDTKRDKPDTKLDRPDKLDTKADTKADKPDTKADKPDTKPDKPDTKPDKPDIKPDKPDTKPDKPDTKPDKPDIKPDNRPPPIDVVDTVNKGLKAFVTGDAKGALTLLKQAKAAKPGYAPTYRVLGKVYKKLGDLASAKAALQKYLKLAPTAPDAEQIKKELEEL